MGAFFIINNSYGYFINAPKELIFKKTGGESGI
jgi:hypothetical protein